MARDLIATETAFYGGSLVQRGERFTFRGGKTPKWAAEVGTKLEPPKAAANPDTKPAAAAKAAKAKAASLTGVDQVV